MNAVGWLIAAYLLAVCILLHLTLLFCSEEHCVYAMETPPVSTEVGFQIRRAIAALLPYEIRFMQKIAQWMVVGEVMVIFLWFLRLASKIIWFLIWVSTAIVLTLVLVTYFSNSNLVSQVSSWTQEQGWVTSEQIDNVTVIYHYLQEKVSELIQ